MLKKIFSLSILIFLSTQSYAIDEKFLANGYWLQRDKNANVNISVVHIYDNKNNKVNAEMFVPLGDADGIQVKAPMVFCKSCGKGNAYGHQYDYSSGSEKFQGLEFAWDADKAEECEAGEKGPVYDQGAVLNPNDGKYYHIKAQTVSYGSKLYVRAYYGWLGITEYWERISQEQAEKIKSLCGLIDDSHYPYEDKERKIINQELFKECSTRNFASQPL